MSSFILCHKKKAKQPFLITRTHHKVYTIEELCYYLCGYLYLVDETIMNERLCDWLEEELELKEMATLLRGIIERDGEVEEFVAAILGESSIYTRGELLHIQETLDKLKNQKPLEKQKYKGDALLEGGSVKAAITAYHDILYGERDESLPGTFYGKVYACLGAAYGRLFLYKEAAKMYEAAYQICEDTAMLRAYLYASKCYMSPAEYEKLLQVNCIYPELDGEIQAKQSRIQSEVTMLRYDDILDLWKERYRTLCSGEI